MDRETGKQQGPSYKEKNDRGKGLAGRGFQEPSESDSAGASDPNTRNTRSKNSTRDRTGKKGQDQDIADRRRYRSQRGRNVSETRTSRYQASGPSFRNRSTERTRNFTDMDISHQDWSNSQRRSTTTGTGGVSSQYHNQDRYAGMMPYDNWSGGNQYAQPSHGNYFGTGQYTGTQATNQASYATPYNLQQYRWSPLEASVPPPPPPPTDIPAAPRSPEPFTKENNEIPLEQIRELIQKMEEEREAKDTEKQVMRRLDDITVKLEKRDAETKQKEFETRIRQEAELRFQQKVEVMKRDEEARMEEIMKKYKQEVEELTETTRQVLQAEADEAKREAETLARIEREVRHQLETQHQHEKRAEHEQAKREAESIARIERDVRLKLEAQQQQQELELKERQAKDAAKVKSDETLRRQSPGPAGDRGTAQSTVQGGSEESKIREVLREFKEEMRAEFYGENGRFPLSSPHQREPNSTHYGERSASDYIPRLPWNYHETVAPFHYMAPTFGRMVPIATRRPRVLHARMPSMMSSGYGIGDMNPYPRRSGDRYVPPPHIHDDDNISTTSARDSSYRRAEYPNSTVQVETPHTSPDMDEGSDCSTVIPPTAASRARSSVSGLSSQESNFHLDLGMGHGRTAEAPNRPDDEDQEQGSQKTAINGASPNIETGDKRHDLPQEVNTINGHTSHYNNSRARTSPLPKAPEVPRLYTENTSYADSVGESSRPEASEPDHERPQITPGKGPVRRTVYGVPPSPTGRSFQYGRHDADRQENISGASSDSESPYTDDYDDYDVLRGRRGGGLRRRSHSYTIGRSVDNDEEAWDYTDGIPGTEMALTVMPWVLLPTHMSNPALQTVALPYGMAAHRRIDRRDNRRAGVVYFQN